MEEKIVKITFESNDKPGKKAVVKIVDDVKITIKFEPKIGKDEQMDYGAYLNLFLKTITQQ